MSEPKVDIVSLSKRLDDAVALCKPVDMIKLPMLQQAVALSKSLRELRDVLNIPQIAGNPKTSLMESVFMPMCGTRNGFTTDKDDKPDKYNTNEVCEALIQAMQMGLRPIGNEFTIISRNAYMGQSGAFRLLREWPGLSALDIRFSTPQPAGEKGAYVTSIANWLIDGKKFELIRGMEKLKDGEAFDHRLVIRVNAGMGADAIWGKAKRKMYYEIYTRLTLGMYTVGFDDDSIDTIGNTIDEPVSVPEPTPENEGRRIKLGGNGKPIREPGEDE
jgi:hypothetical protein